MQDPQKANELRKKLETERELKTLNDKRASLEMIVATMLRAQPDLERHYCRLLKVRAFDGWLNNMIDMEIENEKVDVAVAKANQAAAQAQQKFGVCVVVAAG